MLPLGTKINCHQYTNIGKNLITINFNDPNTLITNKNYDRSRRFLESFFTSQNICAFNRCMQFSGIYVPITISVFNNIYGK